ncbi:hypothetical protein RJT34_18536 [Clitoria ternatea]|uniref:Histone-lysine N-methyltransferase ATX2 n=1 Tax=Clitoria ternatea TaxID=43366 RepID=A0AAN9PE38_CLITE
MAATLQEEGGGAGGGELEDTNIDVHTTRGTPIRYLPLDHLYSATSPCRVTASGSANVMSKKVKARKLTHAHFDPVDKKTTSSSSTSSSSSSLPLPRPPLLHVYSRRRKRRSSPMVSFYDSLVGNKDSGSERRFLKKRKIGSTELEKLGVDLNAAIGNDLHGPRLRECRNQLGNSGNAKTGSLENFPKLLPESRTVKRWVGLSFDDADPEVFVGLRCKVYWPMDMRSYTGYVKSYDKETKIYHVKYDDDDEENLILSNENVKFHVSRDEMKCLKLNYAKVRDCNVSDYDVEEMLALAASLDDCQDFEPGDIIWAKLTGHAMWPAVVLDESLASNCKGLKMFIGGRSVPVQFFGTHDFARVRLQQVKSFLSGLLTDLHSKCKKHSFVEGLEEAKRYLSEQKLPLEMLELQKRCITDDCDNVSGEDGGCTDSGDDCLNDKGTLTALENIETFPYEIGDLQILSLGKIVEDSASFGDGRFIWPKGYTAVRKFTSVTDPKVSAPYKMEVLRDTEPKVRPVFRVTVDGGEQFTGDTPSSCWNQVYKRIKKMQKDVLEDTVAEGEVENGYESGSDMFGFSNPKVVKLIQGLSKSKISSKNSNCKSGSRRCNDLPLGYRQVHINWFDLDKCNVCHMDEEYENNLFLQCDKCRMMVHARCYGELEPVNGVLWLCKLCRSGAPSPPCCLCPLIGGAMKPTTDGRWAHLACAMWIPETCLADVKRMEPIDGLSRISKDRWKLLCSICGVSYGACIQCSNNSCRVAYHPLCARAAGLCVELENEDRLYLLSVDDDEDQCIRLLSFCKKHRQPSNEHSVADERIVRVAGQCSDYDPPPNPSGCARSEPYDYFGRRGRKEPEALAAASLKRLFVENQPYLVGGYCQHGSLDNPEPSGRGVCSKFFCSQQRLRTSLIDTSNSILSIAEKYKYMRETFRKRLAFGKSGIHGFGIFAKHPYKGGDMVIEYTGELVRPPIADRREHFIYNSLVGAGTYMFRIDDERVIDATRAGSIAHLINHSCAPNCYSRVISVNGDEHIIIFAKRDIKQWEELTYDYRFFSIDERLACYCGFPKCRGIVNDTEAEERAATLYAPRSELIDWGGE